MTRTELLQKLKAKRRELADREGVELFMVLTNKALEETVKAMPGTLEDLALVKGWGKVKIAKYGTEVLEIMKDSATSEFTDIAEVGLPHIVRKFDFRNSLETVFSVSEFLEAVNITLARLGTVRIRGEVSEMRHRGSVVYFSLKDASGADAVIKCVLWAWKYERECRYLEDGMEVVVEAMPEVYPKYGSLDMRVERVEPVGEGALRKAFEALKKKLEAKGFFDPARKRPLPAIIQRIGVITSEKGEAINDFLKNIGTYGFEIVLMDVRVEGDHAEESIVNAFRVIAVKRPDLDVLCVIRGGGGLENLQAFNTERVAEAVVSSRIPVLTGIGHERDITIAGLSSDADFSTPTKVADTIRRGREQILRELDGSAELIADRVREIFQEITRAVDLSASNLQRAPGEVLGRMRVKITVSAQKLESALGRVFMAYHALEKRFAQGVYTRSRAIRQLMHEQSARAQALCERMRLTLQISHQRLAVISAALMPLNPEAPLERGYSIAYKINGKVVKSAEDVIVGERIKVRLRKGSIKLKVEDIA